MKRAGVGEAADRVSPPDGASQPESVWRKELTPDVDVRAESRRGATAIASLEKVGDEIVGQADAVRAGHHTPGQPCGHARPMRPSAVVAHDEVSLTPLHIRSIVARADLSAFQADGVSSKYLRARPPRAATSSSSRVDVT